VSLGGRVGLPLVTLVDTPGADPSPEAEEGGIGVEVAATFAAFAACPTPVVSLCVGEGGSGGALALSFADRLLICEHAIFSVIGPEGAASILERDASKAPEIAEWLKLTSKDIVSLGIADAVVPEQPDALHAAVAQALDDATVGDRTRRLDAATRRWLS
jgi:acetyl-CoA carboxylase carboxyl transferase subunit beta